MYRRSFPNASQAHDYLLKNVSLVDVIHGEVHKGASVRLSGGLIQEVYTGPAASSAESFDANGAFLMPGLIDMHVHLIWDGSPDPLTTMHKEGRYGTLLRGVANARRSLAMGVTTVRDVGSLDDMAVDIARAFSAGQILGPTVVPCGRIIQPTGGHVPELGYIADSRDELIKAVRFMKARGAEFIKVASTGGAYGPEEIGPSVYPQEDLEVIVNEAARLGLKVGSHSLGMTGITNAVLAGIKTIEHGANIPPDVLREMKNRGTYLIPTLAVYKNLAESSGKIPEFYVEKSRTVVGWHRETFKLAMEIGTPIALGTDAGSPNFGPHPSVLLEMRTMVEYGMRPAQVVACATCCAAAALGRSTALGSVDPGKAADLLLLDANPLEDVGALSAVRQVIKNGMML